MFWYFRALVVAGCTVVVTIQPVAKCDDDGGLPIITTATKLTKRKTVSLRRDGFSTQGSAFIVNDDNDDPVEVEGEVIDGAIIVALSFVSFLK